MVVRNLLTLRLLTYSPSGAPVVAPTTSLPEHLDGIRNWDYRFAWPRDASIGVSAFLQVGKLAEARGFLGWLLHASRLQRPRLPALFTIAGRHAPTERELHRWPGYAGSIPVLGGNGAADQHQLDGYGWILNAASNLVEAGHHLYPETWRAMRGFANVVADRWTEPDAGIWEIRDDAAHHVHSKLMGWLALDPALRLGDTTAFPPASGSAGRPPQTPSPPRSRPAASTRSGAATPAATAQRTWTQPCILPLLGIEDPLSARVRGTIDTIASEVSVGGPLVYRYPTGQDGLPGTEGAFLPCSFWRVQTLARTGRQAQARHRFQQLLRWPPRSASTPRSWTPPPEPTSATSPKP